MNEQSYYDVDKIFLRGVTVQDIAEPLPSFDANTPAELVKSAMVENNYPLVGVREKGFVSGYIATPDLGTGPCSRYAQAIEERQILNGNALLTELVVQLDKSEFVFVCILGEINGLITRDDMQDPPVRMWLFGLITLIEMRFLTLIERRFLDDSWQRYVSNNRLEKALALQAERIRRNQNPQLLECLQFSDKAQIVVRDETLRKQIGFVSRRRGEEVIKNLEKLRNNLAHAQDIVSLDWQTIVGLSENLEIVIKIGTGEE
jgi:hypothetical protein